MNVIKSKWGTALAILLVIWIGVGLLRLDVSRNNLDKNTKDLHERLSQVEKNNEHLKNDIDNLDNPEYLKTQAKIQLNYKSAEEDLVYIYRDQKNQESGENQKGIYADSMPSYKKWWHWLLNTE